MDPSLDLTPWKSCEYSDPYTSLKLQFSTQILVKQPQTSDLNSIFGISKRAFRFKWVLFLHGLLCILYKDLCNSSMGNSPFFFFLLCSGQAFAEINGIREDLSNTA